MADSSLFDGLVNHFQIDSVGLTSDQFYNTLNHDEKNLEDYDAECRSLLSEKGLLKYNRLCKKLLRFLKNSSKLSDKEDSAYDDCILFNYWMYNEIAQKNNYDYTNKVNPVFGRLQYIWNNLIIDQSKKSYYNKCRPDFDIATQVDWKVRKQLYDYYVNYKPLSVTAKLYVSSCKDIYRYIKSNAPLYDYFKEQCKLVGKYSCPHFYTKCIKYDPNVVLPELPCHEDMKEEESTAAKRFLPVDPQPELPAGDTLSSDGSQIRGDSSPPATQAGNVFLGVVVTSMTSGALYKFTPLGNMLRNRFGWNTNNMRNMQGGVNGLFDYGPESFNPYSGGAEEHYIGYHPA